LISDVFRQSFFGAGCKTREVTPWEYIFHGLNSFACRNFDHDDKVVRLQEKYEDIFRGIRLADILDKNYDLYIEMMKEVDTLSQI